MLVGLADVHQGQHHEDEGLQRDDQDVEDRPAQAGQEVQSEPEGRTTLDDEDVASEPSEFPESDAMPSNSDESQLADETLESIDRPVRTADAFRGAMPESDPLEEQPFDSTESTESEEPSSDARPFPAGFE